MSKTADQEFVKHIAKRDEDFPQWYTDVILKTDMVDYSDVKGCMVIKPYGYGVWELIQAEMDRRFKDTGHVNAYFPLFIPESLLLKEAEHVEGFAPEVAWARTAATKSLRSALPYAHQRDHHRLHVFQVDTVLPRSARADEPVVQRRALGKEHAPLLRTSEFLWQEATPPTPRSTRRRKKPCACSAYTVSLRKTYWPYLW